jgi:hypothetical protein
MDIYAIARIFRDFDSSVVKMDPLLIPKAIMNYVPPFKGTSQNVIYYAGAHHIKFLVIFIEKYLKILHTYKAGSPSISNISDFLLDCPSFVEIDTEKAELLN